jgi:nicotinate-nucleotide adenylyltransferase
LTRPARRRILPRMKRIGILGGTFDPIHLGHLVPAQYAFNPLHLDRLILIPSAMPVHRPRHVPASNEHRLAMCRLAAADIPGFEVSDIEVSREEPSYTIYTLRQLAQCLAGDQLVLLVGEDNLPSLHTWKDIRAISEIAEIAVMPRKDVPSPDLGALKAILGPAKVAEILANRVPSPLVPISATEVRTRVAAGKSVRGIVPTTVARYIAEQQLYRHTLDPMKA